MPILQAQSITELQRSMSALVSGALEEQSEKDHVIALAAKNKALSQKMAKYAILVALGAMPEKNNERMLAAADEFEKTVTGLRTQGASGIG
jgi:hypothetical protein